MTAPSTFKFALACGTAGAYVDVTSDVLFEEGDITFSEGRSSEFDEVRPGAFRFTLANGDGKYTPDNLSTSLATPFTEGMGVVMQIDSLLLSGTVRSIDLIFPPLESGRAARVSVGVDDDLATAARTELGSQNEILGRNVPAHWWPLDDPRGSTTARYRGTSDSVRMSFPSGGYAFGASEIDGVGTSGLTLTGTTTAAAYWQTGGTLSSFSCWIMLSALGGAYISSSQMLSLTPFLIGIEGDSSLVFVQNGSGTRVYGPRVEVGVPYFFTLVPGTTTYAYLNGELFGSVPGGTPVSSTPALSLDVTLVATAPAVATFSQLSSSTLPFDVLAGSTPETRLEGIRSFTSDAITFDTIPALDDVVFGPASLESQSALDALNDVIRSEQGYLWVETGGTLLAPDPLIRVGARDRERAVDYTFDVSEIVDPITFQRNLNNTVSEFTANGPTDSASYQSADLFDLVGSASSSESVLFRDHINLFAYASDRVSRGVNWGIPIVSITVDATSPSISRWSDLTSIRQGHRIHITGLPETQLGYDTWDGYVVGREIRNTQDSNGAPQTFFTFKLSPRLPVAVYGTARYSGELILWSAINSSTTSISVGWSEVGLTTNPAHFPLDIRIDNEVMTVTAATGAFPQVLTVTRGSNPASHSTFAPVTLANAAIVGTDRYAL